MPCREDFSLDLSAFEAAISEKTKAVLINSPNNPTGQVYDAASLAALADLLTRKSQELGRTIYLLSDEPYSDILYDGIQLPGVFAAYANSIIASSYSKALSLAGERIGYIAVNPAIEEPEQLVAGLALCNRMLGFVNAPALMQRIIAKLQGVTVDIGVYERKRNLLYNGLVAAGYDVVKPGGAFYLFPQNAHCRRRGLRSGPQEAADPHRSGQRVLRSRSHPDRLLRQG